MTKRKILIGAISGALYLALSLPFMRLLTVFPTWSVTPSAVLNPFLGISFGLPSAIGITTANLILRIVCGQPIAVILESIVPQFLYCYIPFLLWRFFTKGEDHIHRLDCVMRVIKFTITILTYGIISGGFTALIEYINYGTAFGDSAVFVLLHNFTVSMILGCPLMIVSNQIISRRAGSDRTLTNNERVIIGATVTEILIIGGAIAFLYSAAGENEIYDIWSNLYMYAVQMVLCFMAVVFAVMLFFEVIGKAKKDK